jgi:hypothetical protein
VAILAVTAVLAVEEKYRQVEILQDGRLRILTMDGREIIPPKRHDQVGFDKVAISEDGDAVGWLALYDNCCTSYPIPHELVILVNGQERDFTGSGLPIWRWGFAAGGKQVAFEQETVHGGIGIHYELRDVATGQLVAEYSPGPDNRGEPPGWAKDLDVAR